MNANRRSTAVVLLEVLLALTLFIIAAAVVGSAQRSAIRAAEDMRLQTQAMNLAQSVLADLATGRIELADTPPTPYEEEDETWTYEIVTGAITDADNLKRVTVIVKSSDPARPGACRLTQWMLDPGAQAEQGEFAP
ncbi:MAG: hypothetical protein AMJ81_11095 [Phycisphaerae bacterium SM23_33]|nr:MAG: hypothetical protein AMJ81_11095 [Phycisphaerae bacterium SM23_33]